MGRQSRWKGYQIMDIGPEMRYMQSVSVEVQAGILSEVYAQEWRHLGRHRQWDGRHWLRGLWAR